LPSIGKAAVPAPVSALLEAGKGKTEAPPQKAQEAPAKQVPEKAARTNYGALRSASTNSRPAASSASATSAPPRRAGADLVLEGLQGAVGAAEALLHSLQSADKPDHVAIKNAKDALERAKLARDNHLAAKKNVAKLKAPRRSLDIRPKGPTFGGVVVFALAALYSASGTAIGRFPQWEIQVGLTVAQAIGIGMLPLALALFIAAKTLTLSHRGRMAVRCLAFVCLLSVLLDFSSQNIAEDELYPSPPIEIAADGKVYFRADVLKQIQSWDGYFDMPEILDHIKIHRY
jgi:hypothetical protein